MESADVDTLGGLGCFQDHVPVEQRGEDRLELSRQPDGRISVLTPYARVAASLVRDISRSGISLELERPISAETPVSVEYVARDIQLSVNGRLAWTRNSEARSDGSDRAAYVVGIELFSPGLLLNFLPTASH